MEYKGNYGIFNPAKISTYPLSTRTNKVKLENLVMPGAAKAGNYVVPEPQMAMVTKIAEHVIQACRQNQPVIVFSGAHLIKNGLGPLIADLVNRSIITLFAGNGATAIHDFELAMVGETSEYVPQALEKGQFGMAYEFAHINNVLQYGNKLKLGYGESLGRMICEETFRNNVIGRGDLPLRFLHSEVSILATCYKKNIPCTIHVGIGTDVIDQHSSFDGQAKGGCSGRDFLIYTNEVAKLINGGVILNIGSAVTGPEVLLKAVSMAANVGLVPKGIITADFDLRVHNAAEMSNESASCYYFRDQKSVLTRIPEAFGGQGYYVQGNQKVTVPLLYKKIIEMLGSESI
jgi:hypothetical protein